MDDEEITIETDGREERGSSEEELEATESRADSKVTKIKKELDACKKERQEYMDGWQRSKADYVNLLKRFDAEKASSADQAASKVVKSLLPAYDALTRAKEHGDVPEGFAGIMRQLESAFKSLSMTPIGEVGEVFDPMLHEALGQDPTDDKAKDDTVTAVLENGYKLRETVLRPARVRVAHFEE